jgi:hypothetical protein
MGIMAKVIRTDVATPYSKCLKCGVGTRSHVLEPAQYDEFTEEVITEESDDFAKEQWEEVETITKYALSDSAVVMCHKCWLKSKEVMSETLDKFYDSWMKSPQKSLRRIMSFTSAVKYYNYERSFSPSESIKVAELRKAAKMVVKGEIGEEE